MQFVSRVYFNGNPSVFEDTEVVLARDAVAVFLPESDSRFLVVFTHVVSRVAQMIGWYGDDGHGDKPKEMPRFTYWFQHQDTAEISAIVEHLQERPAKLSIVCIDKPASSAPKCFTCKEKLVRGDFALQEREYDHRGLSPKMAPQLVEIISQTNSKEWDWRVRWSKMRCLKTGCVGLLADASRCRRTKWKGGGSSHRNSCGLAVRGACQSHSTQIWVCEADSVGSTHKRKR